MPEELQAKVHNIVQEAVIKTIAKKKKRREAKRLSDEALQIAEKRSEVKWKSFSCVRLFVTPMDYTQSMEFSRPEYCSG